MALSHTEDILVVSLRLEHSVPHSSIYSILRTKYIYNLLDSTSSPRVLCTLHMDRTCTQSRSDLIRLSSKWLVCQKRGSGANSGDRSPTGSARGPHYCKSPILYELGQEERERESTEHRVRRVRANVGCVFYL